MTTTATDAPSDGDELEAIRSRYIEALTPLFFPEHAGKDIIRYFASLLRIAGMEDGGWDPYSESRNVLEDINGLMQLELPNDKFPDKDRTVWRLGLNLYSHIVEMDAPYEVLTNLLRYRLDKGYSPNPFYDFLSAKRRKRAYGRGLSPRQKIDVIKHLSTLANLEVHGVLAEFFRADIRNAISHSDFIFANEDFRSRNGNWGNSFIVSYDELSGLITKAKAFIGAFFVLEKHARLTWGKRAGAALPYDAHYKGLLEILVDGDRIMDGFKVHWPNNMESVFRRTSNDVEMTNCLLDLKEKNINFFVGLYPRNPGTFSPLVAVDEQPKYTKLIGKQSEISWPINTQSEGR